MRGLPPDLRRPDGHDLASVLPDSQPEEPQVDRQRDCKMALVSPGFSGRRDTAGGKLPPGQYLTAGFPVLSAGPTPQVSLEKWELTIEEGTDVLRRWDWKSFRS